MSAVAFFVVFARATICGLRSGIVLQEIVRRAASMAREPESREMHADAVLDERSN